MEGGVVTIRFEADTTAVESSIKNIEKSAKSINLKDFNAETRRISANAKDIAARAKETLANQRLQVVAMQEGSKSLRAQAQINKTNAQVMKAQVDALKAGVKSRETDLKVAKFQYQQEKDKNKAVRQTQKAQNDTRKTAIDLLATYYMISRAIHLIKEAWDDFNKAIKNTLNFLGKFSSTLYKTFKPIETLTGKFLQSSGLLNKAKQLFSFNSISNFSKSAIEAASDLTEVQNIVETAFPNMTNQMEEWAKKSIQAFGLSEKSAKEYASTLGLMAQSAGLTEKASYKLGTSLTAVTADLASIYNMDQRAVYEKIRSGVIGGRTMAIAQLGINMNQANLQAYMESKGLSQKYNSLDNATKTLIRYNYVLEQTRKIQGDFVKTQGTWANQTRMLAENITALKASLGTLFVSVLTPLIQRINQLLQLLTKIVNRILTILPLFGIKIQKAAASGSSGVGDLTEGLEDAGYAADEAGKKIAKLTDGPFSEMHKVGDDGADLASKMKDVFGGDGLLDYENPYGEGILGEIDSWLNKITSKYDVVGLFDEMKRLFTNILDWISDIKEAWKAAWDSKGGQFVQSLIDMLQTVLSTINDISDAFNTMFQSDYGQMIFESMLETATKLNETVEKIVSRFKEFWNSGSGHYGSVKKSMAELGEEAARNQSMTLGPGRVYRELTWGEYLAQQFYETTLKVEELKQVILDFVGEIGERIDWEHIFENAESIMKQFQATLESLSQYLKDNPELADKVAQIIKNVSDGFTNFVNDVLKYIEQHPDVLDKILDFFVKLSSHTEEILKLTAAIQTLGPAISGLAKLVGAGILTKGVLNFAKGSSGGAGGAAAAGGGSALLGFFSKAALVAGLVELGSIISNSIREFKLKFEEGFTGISDFLGWFFLELPDKIRGPISQAFVDVWLDTIAAIKKGWDEHVVPWWNEKLEVIKGVPETIKENLDKIKDYISEFVSGFIDKFNEAIDKAKELGNSIRESVKEKVDNSFVGKTAKFIGGAWTNFTSHANGGVFAPNQPHLAILGDNTRDTEYALTESHLDIIANRMTAAIVGGLARVNLAGAGSGTPNVYVQIGDREIKDLIVQTVDEKNYRRF